MSFWLLVILTLMWYDLSSEHAKIEKDIKQIKEHLGIPDKEEEEKSEKG